MYFIPVLVLFIAEVFDINTVIESYTFTAWHWLILVITMSMVFGLGYCQGKDIQ